MKITPNRLKYWKSLRNKKLSNDHKNKISKGLKKAYDNGSRIVDTDTRKKMSEAQLGDLR